MEYRKFGQTYVIRMDRGEEVMENLTEICRRENIGLAAVQAIGACDRAVLGLYDVERKEYHRKTLTGAMEITSLLGTVTQKDGAPYLHLHATLCDENLVSRGGHVNEITISATCEMVVTPISGQVGRTLDPVTGLNIFQF